MTDLLPCPFCGCEPTFSFPSGGYPEILCTNCYQAGTTLANNTEAEAIEAWNTRYLQTVQCIDCTWFENRSESGAYCGYFDRELGDDYDGGCLWGATSGYPLQEKPAWNTRAERTCHMERVKAFPGTNCDFVCWICSVCGKTNDEHKPNYCPNCGAKVQRTYIDGGELGSVCPIPQANVIFEGQKLTFDEEDSATFAELVKSHFRKLAGLRGDAE